MLLIKCRVFAGLLAFKSSMNLLSTNSNLNQIVPAYMILLRMILIEKEKILEFTATGRIALS